MTVRIKENRLYLMSLGSFIVPLLNYLLKAAVFSRLQEHPQQFSMPVALWSWTPGLHFRLF